MLKSFLFFFLGIPLGFASHSLYGSNAVPMSASHEYLQKSPEPDFWALSPYYVGQTGGGASSIASMIMILNYARNNLPIPAPTLAARPSATPSRNVWVDPSPSVSPSPSPTPSSAPSSVELEMITQDVLLRKTAEGEWSKNAGNPGSSLTLDQLAHVIEESCQAFGFANARATAYHAHKTEDFKKTLHDALIENKRTSDDFILADFNESAFVGEVDIDHVAPVGAYDAVRKRILVMDPDRQFYEPYWVSEATFLEGMATADKITGMARGFIWLKLR
jgi:hypothetical protein